MKNSKIFFILAVIGIVITIIMFSISLYYGNKAYELSGKFTYNEPADEATETEELFRYISIVTGGISVILLITGTVLKIKEKGGIKIVD